MQAIVVWSHVRLGVYYIYALVYSDALQWVLVQQHPYGFLLNVKSGLKTSLLVRGTYTSW